jgi:tRNA pseudouridine55 synthase
VTPAGIILIDKPEGVTSFGALHPVKKALGRKVKVGHTGTLDKFASGLLVVCAGGYTRLASVLTAADKTYEARIRFGIETDTLDPSGEITAEAAIPSRERLLEVLPDFRGTIHQRPPLFSALHVDGERAYKRALRGETVEMAEREVTVHSLELLSYREPFADIRVSCSKGTYIRSLARDIALAAGTRAHLSELRRTSVAAFSAAQAVRPDLFDPTLHLLQGEVVIHALSEYFITAVIDDDLSRAVRNGTLPSKSVLEACFAGEESGLKNRLLLFSEAGRLVSSISRAADGGFFFDFVVGE